MSSFLTQVLCSTLLVGAASLVADTTAHADTPAAPAAAATAAKTIILVHGAFADGSSWDKVTPILTAAGYNVVALYEPLTSLADDVAATKRAIDAQPGPVLLVGHSWGGVVITQAGNHDKVSGLVFVAAFAPDAGESVNDLGKNSPPPEWTKKLILDAGGFLTLPLEVVSKDFAPDLSAADAKLLTAKQGPIAAKSFADKVTTAAWKTKPSWFVRAEADHMIDPAGQQLMAMRAGSKLTSVKGASHVVMLSKPKDVAAVILAAASGKK
jgi:pimeloyl-ACP methyl ester carboxylesterase